MNETNSVISKRQTGKVAIVTAASNGVGFATARRLAQEGAIVIISGRNSTNVETAIETLKKEGLEVRGVVCRVNKQEVRTELIKKAIEINGKIDIFIFVPNANIVPINDAVLDTSEEEWNSSFDVNAKSAYLLTKEIIPYMAKGGSIVYVSSIAGLAIYPQIPMYSITQTALIALSRAAAYPLSKLGIRVNCVSLGLSDSDFTKMVKDNQITTKVLKLIPLKRFCEPHEVASLIAFLCSDEASYITGENYVIAGGLHSRL